MRRTNRIIPTYTGDVSGACSALFELGGMVVIHDPSGCNSTYNTHDETRWYDHDSLIYITGLIERDAILGNDDKLVRDVVAAARELHPRFIALCNSPIPFISGTDFAAICRLIERETQIPTFYVRTNGMHDYVVGAGNAFVALAERFVEARPVREGTCNILGATPLDLGIAGSDASLRAFARRAGFEVVSCWAMGSGLDELTRAAEAQVNLVISATGLPLAHLLRERFGTPFVVGMPIGLDLAKTGRPDESSWLRHLSDALEMAAKTGKCLWPCRDLRGSSTESMPLDHAAVGEPVIMGSIATARELNGLAPVRVLSPLEATTELLAPHDLRIDGEEEAEEALRETQWVLADNLYAPIVPASATFVTLPHQAFSGRNSWNAARDPVTLKLA